MDYFTESLDGTSVPLEDTFIGALYDDTGLALMVLLRVCNPGGMYSTSEVMAVSPYGEVFVIEHANAEGLFRKRFMIRLANPLRTIQFTPADIFEVEEGSIAKSLAAATTQHTSLARRAGGKDVLTDFWAPVDKKAVAAFRLLAKGTASVRLAPPK